ncbi:uncharacterized protein LOC110653701 isoform X2 [Hevea brasiliensis]|uniref:uncharacterized protein LOC110653701 isoform X2 n=1 Tax=Hevea brasiliensis TaxID=3981 RepID=UPI0025F3A61F|nr:uncharacterized protein LOC110653701 isoform X2 [Hevea brasiliensis]
MSLQENAPSLVVAGVTGAVGQEFLSVICDHDFPYRSIKMLASKRSAGKQITFQDRNYMIEELTAESFHGVDIALFSAGGSIRKHFGPVAMEKGAIMVGNSSAFRMNEGIPLVIPEVNSEAMEGIKVGMGKRALIANLNCSTIICLMAATPLHRHAKVQRMVVSTYQAASGAVAAAMEKLELQTRLGRKTPLCKIFKRKNDMNVQVTATCIPVLAKRAHAKSVNLQFEKPLDEDTTMDILKNASWVVVIDDCIQSLPCTIRGEIIWLDIFVYGSQICKGAALNAIQIAELLLEST